MAVSLKVNNWLFVTDQTPRLLLTTFQTSFLIRRRGEREEVTQLSELQKWQKNETKSYVKSPRYTGLPDGVIFKPKISFWVNFRGPWNGKVWEILWNILRPFGIHTYFTYGHLAIKRQFGTFPPFWYIASRKIWQLWLVQSLLQ
jgi:hypothetical protein